MITQGATQFYGLTENEVEASRGLNGSNEIEGSRSNAALHAVAEFFKDPMIILLLVATILYFVNGSEADGVFMLVAILLITAISGYQERRSKRAIDSLRRLTEPLCTAVREGIIQEIRIQNVVVRDVIQVSQGRSIPADGVILSSNDFTVNESVLTGEPYPVYKVAGDRIFRGTLVVDGLAWYEVQAVGKSTEIGKISRMITSISEQPSPLQRQVNTFVKGMALVGMTVFFVVWALHFKRLHDWSESLLESLTLAMSILPEEIPVALTAFMAIGSWRLMQLGIIVKNIRTVETLGSASVICLDKTGTITENEMAIGKVTPFPQCDSHTPDNFSPDDVELIETAMWASEPLPFDSMEKVLHQMYEKTHSEDRRKEYALVKEYPLSGVPPMMTHVFESAEGHPIIAMKGAPEALIRQATISSAQREEIERAYKDLASQGYRVLAVGSSTRVAGNYPETQSEFEVNLKGLVAFIDPPKKNAREVIQNFYDAGIDVKILTGDSAPTTQFVANAIGLRNSDRIVDGQELVGLTDGELKAEVQKNTIFSRMFPEAKLNVLNALKAAGHVVAMTGDGVNDGAALKSAHVGIAMGKRGSEVAKEAAAMIITDDDVSKIVDAIGMARRIYSNLKKAIRYIISIHIPIVAIIFVPLVLGWKWPSLFSPVHVIFLELIMGPTCSVVYENEPIQKNLLLEHPRKPSHHFLTFSEVVISVIQGIVITFALLFMYKFLEHDGRSVAEVRTMIFIALISANILLTLINRSFEDSVLTTIQQKNHLIPVVIGISILLTVLVINNGFLSNLFQFTTISVGNATWAILVGLTSVAWFEGVKVIVPLYNRLRINNRKLSKRIAE